jgi:hypothetical protein
MTQELIYTSAPKGLKPGSRGFCTVASSTGMARPLVERLESLSGYRHLYAPGDPKAALNPVAWLHLRLVIGGATYHVLTRIGDAGLDYSGRTNKIAHHVVCSPKELNEQGPAWCLSQAGWMESIWQGEPRLLTADRPLPTGDASPDACPHWKRATGDAGWAGILAQTAYDQRPAVIIYPLGFDILPLLLEAQQLLAPSVRWQVSFSTYLMKLPPGIECQWQCYPADGSDLSAQRRAPNTLVINLSEPLGTAPDSPASFAARQGLPIPVPGREPPTQPPRRPTDTSDLTSEEFGDAHELPLPDADAVVSPAATHAPPPPSLRRHPVRPSQPTATSPHRSPATWLILAGLVIGLIGFGVGFLASTPSIDGELVRRAETETAPEIDTIADDSPTTPPTPSAASNTDEQVPEAQSQNRTDPPEISGGVKAHRQSENPNDPSHQKEDQGGQQDTSTAGGQPTTDSIAASPDQPKTATQSSSEEDTISGQRSTPTPNLYQWKYLLGQESLYDQIDKTRKSQTEHSTSKKDISVEVATATGQSKWGLRSLTVAGNALNSRVTDDGISVFTNNPLLPEPLGTFKLVDNSLCFTQQSDTIIRYTNAMQSLSLSVVSISDADTPTSYIPLWGELRQTGPLNLILDSETGFSTPEISDKLPIHRFITHSLTPNLPRFQLSAHLVVKSPLIPRSSTESFLDPLKREFSWDFDKSKTDSGLDSSHLRFTLLVRPEAAKHPMLKCSVNNLDSESVSEVVESAISYETLKRQRDKYEAERSSKSASEKGRKDAEVEASKCRDKMDLEEKKHGDAERPLFNAIRNSLASHPDPQNAARAITVHVLIQLNIDGIDEPFPILQIGSPDQP